MAEVRAFVGRALAVADAALALAVASTPVLRSALRDSGDAAAWTADAAVGHLNQGAVVIRFARPGRGRRLLVEGNQRLRGTRRFFLLLASEGDADARDEE